MTEIQRPYLSDREAREQFEETLLNDPVISNHYFQAYMDDPESGDSFLDYCWVNRKEDLK